MILILAILLLVFGPTKLPKMARELGKAWHEFNKASSGIMETVNSKQLDKDNNERKKLITEVARKLDVNIEGKTNEQLTDEILTEVINREETPN